MNLQEVIKSYEINGYECNTFSYIGHDCVIVIPKQWYPGSPWVWRTEFYGYFDWADRALLEKGWHIVYAQMSDWYGAPRIVDFMEKFYSYMVAEYNLSSKVDIFGFSRGGLYALNYTAKNPVTVSTLYLDAPVVDLASWPGGFYSTTPHLEKEWNEACNAYELSSEELMKYRNNLEEKVAVLIKHQTKLLLVAGDQDVDVPYEENGALLEQLYDKYSGNMKVVLKEKCGHHPHSLEHPEEIVEYMINNFKQDSGRQ